MSDYNLTGAMLQMLQEIRNMSKKIDELEERIKDLEALDIEDRLNRLES